MAQLDIALNHFARLLKKCGCKKTLGECQEFIDGSDAEAACKWLCKILLQQENDEQCTWNKRRSGVLLFEADLIAQHEVELGAVVLQSRIKNKKEPEEALT